MSSLVVPIDPAAPSANYADLWNNSALGDSAKKVGTTRVFFTESKVIALSSLGENYSSKKADEKREIVRKSIGSGVKALKALDGVTEIEIDASQDAQASSVAAYLAVYDFTLKTTPTRSRFDPNLKEPIPAKINIKPAAPSTDWDSGYTYAYAQNFARTLMELPANVITPTEFCNRTQTEFSGLGNVEIFVRDAAWAEEKGMRTFLSVTHGTNEPAKFLEIHYKGGNIDDRPIALLGKGITFDSGGISLKPGAGMKAMRADMGGAASVVAATWAAAKLQLPVNIVTCTPLTENLPGPSATKPGDVIYAMNGKSVEVDNTDAEGRLVLSDALYYTNTEYKPHTMIDVATLTGAMDVALGEIFTGVFSSSDELWNDLNVAGEYEFDRLWRMPLSEDYGPQIYTSNADVCNVGGTPAGSATAALFLKNFVDGIEGDAPTLKWAHLDIAGTMQLTRPTPYMETGMSGLSVRALIEFVRRASGTA
ncbi:leucine aminopeptidase [Moniliophthora roreri MCA 2997]|uniref:Leucine aminopeptidase n=1 Tax=Moniliophthora roreri (strain MCA 2997) TaxID=1381753 RepID=V2YV38_MONRO|nr:leucine aminopeptidase [Moniliophthora roreri MCA 2997]